MTQGTAAVKRFTVIFGVKEKFRLANHAVRTAKTRHHIIDFHHLVNSIGRPSLLAVTESGVGDMDIPVLDGSEIKFNIKPTNANREY